MSFQEQQQPNSVYPNAVDSSSNHSNGSFGSVFIVLAVIVVVSAVACFLSRLCSKRHHHRSPKQSQSHHQGPPMPRPEKREPKQGHHGNFNDRGMGDIEFGFGKGLGFPKGKKFGNGENIGKGAKVNPNVRFEFRGDPRAVGVREAKGGGFSAI